MIQTFAKSIRLDGLESPAPTPSSLHRYLSFFILAVSLTLSLECMGLVDFLEVTLDIFFSFSVFLSTTIFVGNQGTTESMMVRKIKKFVYNL